ncbi:hypothetical protein ACEYXF_11385 [Streptomyces asiaticus]|uniref:hypothetical protein n=1 Tax=Streptomyces asiaticus TaxID=114695 RepID=UPI0039BDC1EA
MAADDGHQRPAAVRALVGEDPGELVEELERVQGANGLEARPRPGEHRPVRIAGDGVEQRAAAEGGQRVEAVERGAHHQPVGHAPR